MNTPQHPPRQSLIIAAFAAIYLIWGSTFIAVLIAIRDIPPFLMGGIRFTTAGIILFIYARVKKHSVPPPKDSARIALTGVMTLFFGTGAVAFVEQYISSGFAAIVVATVPIWFILLDKRQWVANFSNKWIVAGLLIGFIGVLTLFADKNSLDFSGDPMKIWSVFILLAGTMCWAIGSLYSKYAVLSGSTLMKASIQMIGAGLVSLSAGFLYGEHHHFTISQVTRDSLFALLYLIFIGSLIGYIAYFWLLSVRSPAIVGTYAYVNPVVAVFLGWLIAGETISGQQVIALTVIVSGVVLVTFSKKKKQKVSSHFPNTQNDGYANLERLSGKK
ncbi:MAG: EamA family transporter [Chitinophagaceae bacterium]|nr:MAG: EamA family transporter [Chitinophagaceae bacterium]